jgi:LAO/AO transport system kinase
MLTLLSTRSMPIFCGRASHQFQKHLCRSAAQYNIMNTVSPSRMTVSTLSGATCWESMTETTRSLADRIVGKADSADSTKNPWYQKRVALSRAITLMESKNEKKKQQGDYLLTYLLSKADIPEPPGTPTTLRVGFAGPPGAGKSSLLEAFGMYLLDQDPDLQLAVVCIDPSSGISGGSILGDKTRMTELSRQDRAYVRPSSNSGVLGGLAAYTDDVVTTLGAAGYPLVLVETVGLGQSEIEVFESVDILVLLLPPGGGDELQGVKKGIVELANILAVTKADGNLLETAKATAGDYRGAMSVLQSSNSSGGDGEESIVWKPRILLTSSVTKDGLDTLWQSIKDYKEHLKKSGVWQKKRTKQAKYWMWKQFTRMMQHRMQQDPELAEQANLLESEMLKGHLTPRVAAQELLDGIFRQMEKKST